MRINTKMCFQFIVAILLCNIYSSLYKYGFTRILKRSSSILFILMSLKHKHKKIIIRSNQQLILTIVKCYCFVLLSVSKNIFDIVTSFFADLSLMYDSSFVGSSSFTSPLAVRESLVARFTYCSYKIDDSLQYYSYKPDGTLYATIIKH